jgi:hypothetical protein
MEVLEERCSRRRICLYGIDLKTCGLPGHFYTGGSHMNPVIWPCKKSGKCAANFNEQADNVIE